MIKKLLYFVALYTLIYLYRLDAIPLVLFDESPYANTAFSFLTTGYFKNTLGGFSGQDLCLYPFVLSIFFKICNTSLFWGRFTSFILGGISLCLFYAIIFKDSTPEKTNKKQLFFSSLLTIGFIFLNTNIVTFRIIRPESLLICISLALLYFSLKKERSPIQWGIIGFLCSLNALNHYVGFIFSFGVMLALALQEFSKKQYRFMLYSFIGTIPIALVFILNITNLHGSISNFLTEIHESEKLLTDFSQLSLLKINLSNLYHHYAMGFKRAIIVLIEFGIVGYGFFQKDIRVKLLCISIFLYIAYGLYTINVFLRPYFVLLPIITLLIMHFCRSKTMLLICSLYIFYHCLGDAYFFYKHISNTDFDQIVHEFREELNEPIPIYGPHEFWFISPQHEFHRGLPKSDTMESDCYIFTTPFKLKNGSATSKNNDNFSKQPEYKLYNTLLHIAEKQGQPIKTVSTQSYDTITLYRVTGSK